MPANKPRVFTRQRAFLLEHGFNLDDIALEPLGDTGVRALRFGPQHPWHDRVQADIFGGAGWGEYFIPYPDDAVRHAALEARDADWHESIDGGAAALVWAEVAARFRDMGRDPEQVPLHELLRMRRAVETAALTQDTPRPS